MPRARPMLAAVEGRRGQMHEAVHRSRGLPRLPISVTSHGGWRLEAEGATNGCHLAGPPRSGRRPTAARRPLWPAPVAGRGRSPADQALEPPVADWADEPDATAGRRREMASKSSVKAPRDRASPTAVR